MLSTFSGKLRAGPLREVLSRSGYADRCGRGTKLEVWRERPFILNARGRFKNLSLLSGRFDRVVVGRDSASGKIVFAEVLDFKTSSQSAALDHAEQMAAYRWAAATLLGLDEGRVESQVVFLG